MSSFFIRIFCCVLVILLWGIGKMSSKRLTLSQDNRMVGGVCGGIGEYFNIDPTIIRIIMVIVALLDGAGVVLYIFAWIIIPDD